MNVVVQQRPLDHDLNVIETLRRTFEARGWQYPKKADLGSIFLNMVINHHRARPLSSRECPGKPQNSKFEGAASLSYTTRCMLLNLTYVKIVLSKFTYPLKTKSRQSLAGMLVPHRSSFQMFSTGSCSRANLWLYGYNWCCIAEY